MISDQEDEEEPSDQSAVISGREMNIQTRIAETSKEEFGNQKRNDTKGAEIFLTFFH